jgi:hypothetical protein
MKNSFVIRTDVIDPILAQGPVAVFYAPTNTPIQPTALIRPGDLATHSLCVSVQNLRRRAGGPRRTQGLSEGYR